MQADWSLAAALLGGTRAMRAAGETYLPKWPNEEREAYQCRLTTAVLFPAYARTVQTLAGKPFSKPVTYGDDVPPKIQEWLEDADLQGRNLDAFAADMMETALGYGLGGILVEYPRAEGVRTVADERAAGLRPYLVEIKPTQILGYRVERRAGAWVLTQLRFKETASEPDGEFGDKAVEQVRVLTPGAWATYRKTATIGQSAQDWALHEQGLTTIDFIPFVPVYGQRIGFMMGKPPLLEVAHLNVAHWQSASDQQTILHVARVPILTVIGIDDENFKMSIGAASAVQVPLGGDMKFVEHSGAAISAGAQELDSLEERMRQAGAELLVLAPGKVTATQVSTENAVGMCALQRIVQGLEDAIDLALQYVAEWVGLPDGGRVTLFNDFGAATLEEASAQLLLSANQAGKISDATLRSEFKRRGILSSDVDEDEEVERIEAQGPALGALGMIGAPVEGDPAVA